jgi:hypothetical protein
MIWQSSTGIASVSGNVFVVASAAAWLVFMQFSFYDSLAPRLGHGTEHKLP